jgi:hypothetical protein
MGFRVIGCAGRPGSAEDRPNRAVGLLSRRDGPRIRVETERSTGRCVRPACTRLGLSRESA